PKIVVVNNVPQLVDKKGGNYAAIAPKLKPGKFNKRKKRMLFYLAGVEPYYLKCIKDGPFQQKKTVEDDIMEPVISCEIAKATWTDLVHNFKGPSDTKENRIMELKLEYQTFRAKPTESLSQTYTRYKTLLNELANDGVNLSKHEINGESKQILALYFALVLVLIIKPVEISLGELWDCQLGSFTAGKDSGGGGKGLSMGEIGVTG
ncbi:hypothetical protein Tco_0281154, partial [Tanacetum coccineum]